jgi:hypothetical protein
MIPAYVDSGWLCTGNSRRQCVVKAREVQMPIYGDNPCLVRLTRSAVPLRGSSSLTSGYGEAL